MADEYAELAEFINGCDDVTDDVAELTQDQWVMLRAELARLRTLAARAEANERDAERWRRVVEIVEYELNANRPEAKYWIGKRVGNLVVTCKDSSHA